MRVLKIVGRGLEVESQPYVFADGDAYVIDANQRIWIWLGNRCQIEEKGAAAWAAQKLDLDRESAPRIWTTKQGEEPSELLNLMGGEIRVERSDTPGFLKHIQTEVDKTYALFKVNVEAGEVDVDQVPFKKDELRDDDVFVIDGYDVISVWIGRDAAARERYEGGKLAKKIDMERRGDPLVYVISQGEEPDGFWELFKIT